MNKLIALFAAAAAAVAVLAAPAGAAKQTLLPCPDGSWVCYYSAWSNDGVWQSTPGFAPRDDNRGRIEHCLAGSNTIQLRYQFPDDSYSSVVTWSSTTGCSGGNMGFGSSYAKAQCRINIQSGHFLRCHWR